MRCGRRCFIVACGVILAGALGNAHAQQRGAAELRLNEGIESFRNENYTAAREQLEAACRLAPDLAAPRFLLGLTFMQLAAQAPNDREERDLLERALAEFDRSQMLDPELVASYVDVALAQTMLGRYDRAESALAQFLQRRPDEPLPYLVQAILRYRQGREDSAQLPKALESLEQASAALNTKDQPDPRIRAYIEHYRGLVYLEQRLNDEARTAFAQSALAAPDAPVGQSSQLMLDQIDRREIGRRRPWDLELEFGLDYDTNVALLGQGIKDRDNRPQDGRFGMASAFSWRLIDRENTVAGIGFETFNSWNFERDEFNVQTYGANLFASWSPPDLDWVTFGIRYDYDYSLVGNEPFLSRHRLTPQIDFRLLEWTQTTVYYQWDTRDYQYDLVDPRLDRDGNIHAVGLMQGIDLFNLFERKVRGNVGYRFETNGTEGGEFSNDTHILAAGLEVPLPWDFTFDFRSEWEFAHYRGNSLFDIGRERRVDDITTLVFGISRKFSENVILRFQVDWTQADSNVRDQYYREPFTYDRLIYGATLTYRF